LPFRLKLIIFLIILVWFVGIFIEFIIPYNNNFVFLLPFLHKSYSLVCHQQPEKLIAIGYKHTLVCARCTGIYSGALISSFLLLVLKMKNQLNIKFLLIASIPMFLDVILYSLGIYRYSKTIAFSTGILLGSVGFLYIHEGILNLIKEKKKQG